MKMKKQGSSEGPVYSQCWDVSIVEFRIYFYNSKWQEQNEESERLKKTTVTVAFIKTGRKKTTTMI